MKLSAVVAVILSAALPSGAFAQNYAASRSAVPSQSVASGAAGMIPIVPISITAAGFQTLAAPMAASLTPTPGVTAAPISALTVTRAQEKNAPTNVKISATAAASPRAEANDEEGSQTGRPLFDGAAEHASQAFEIQSAPEGARDQLTLRKRGFNDAVAPRRASPPSARESKAKPVFVMTPLTPISDWGAFRKQLDTLKRNGISGVTTDLWWGKFEGAGQGKFDWSYYQKYAETVRAAGLQWEPILSFHRCGGNVGDDCNEPLPSWLWKSSPNADQEMKFIDEKGFVNDEYISFWHESAYAHYESAMASFASNFSPYADVISRISVSLGPAGELRYPSYNFAAGWTYPQRGRLQAYSTAARKDFRASIRRQYQDDLKRLNLAWGTALNSFDEIQPPSDGDLFFQTATRTPYGRDFLGWYQGALEGHLERMMALAHKQLSPALPARLIAKMSGVHWLYNSPNMPHAAENAAGYVDYERMVSRFQAVNVDLTFTALEMDDASSNDVGPGEPPPFSAPQTLARRIAALARERGVAIWGENALPISNGESRRYRNISTMLASEGFIGFSLLRLSNIVDAAGEPTSEMAPFVNLVVTPPAKLRLAPAREKGTALAPLLAWTALAGGLLLGAPWMIANYAALAAVSGWAANAVFLFFPWVQIRENSRNSRALSRGGEEAREADKRLGGVSAGSQAALIGGNMLNYPSFLASGNAALIGNSLMGAAGSLAILLQLAQTGHFSRGRWALMTAGVVAATILPLALPVPALAFQALGIAATAIFSYFTVPQILKNRKSLDALRDRTAEPQSAKDALERLKGISPRYLFVALLGNLLLVPVFMVSGHWWNVLGGLIGIFGPLLILNQLSKAGLFSQNKLTQLAVASSILCLALTAAAYSASTAFWL